MVTAKNFASAKTSFISALIAFLTLALNVTGFDFGIVVHFIPHILVTALISGVVGLPLSQRSPRAQIITGAAIGITGFAATLAYTLSQL